MSTVYNITTAKSKPNKKAIALLLSVVALIAVWTVVGYIILGTLFFTLHGTPRVLVGIYFVGNLVVLLIAGIMRRKAKRLSR